MFEIGVFSASSAKQLQFVDGEDTIITGWFLHWIEMRNDRVLERDEAESMHIWKLTLNGSS